MASTTSIIYPIPPVPNKRGQGMVGSDLIVTYHSDLAQCEILAKGSRYLNSGNFKAGSFLSFHQPSFLADLYPHLLSTEDGEDLGLPVLLSMSSLVGNGPRRQPSVLDELIALRARIYFPSSREFTRCIPIRRHFSLYPRYY